MWRVRGLSRISLSYNVLPLFSADASIYVSFSPSYVVGGTGSDAQENFILWNLRAGFRISRKLRIFVDGENLLAQRYEINAGFPMPRATVLGGLDMHF